MDAREFFVQDEIELQGYSLLYSSNEVREGISDIAASIVVFYSEDPVVNIIPVMTGGMQFSAILLMHLENQCPGKWKVSPVLCSAYASDSVQDTIQIEFPSSFDSKIESEAPTLVVDDIYDSGRTISELFLKLKDKRMKSIEFAVLINRVASQREFNKPTFSVFNLNSESWVVGYGLDSDGFYRGLSAIYTKL